MYETRRVCEPGDTVVGAAVKAAALSFGVKLSEVDVVTNVSMSGLLRTLLAWCQ